jgi:glycosyltransferase involved in cell wall biosynthesis
MDVIPGVSPRVVSIVCPVKNMSGRLRILENWIGDLSQEPQIEVVVVHDFSDDSTGEELELICEKYDSVTLVQGQFGNPGSARNAGLEICTGSWISFWDCDDEPKVQEFLVLIDKIESTKPDISFGRFNVFNENSKLITESPIWSSAMDKNLEIVGQNPGIWRVIFSIDLLKNMAFEPLRMAEDQIYIAEAIVKASKVTFYDNLIYTYFTGFDYHLTKNRSALQDLLPAFNQTSKMIRVSKREVHPFLQLMAARQLISGLKFGNLKTRTGLIKSVIVSGLLFRPKFATTIYRSIINSKWSF